MSNQFVEGLNIYLQYLPEMSEMIRKDQFENEESKNAVMESYIAILDLEEKYNQGESI